MRHFINLVEAPPFDEPSVTTKTRDTPTFDFLSGLDKGAVATARQREVVPGQKAGRKTRQKLRRMNVDPEIAATAGAHLASLGHAEDEISDAEAHRRSGMDVGAAEVEPKPVENLPAVISREVAHTGGRVNPDWHQVKQLPGYMQSGIRALGRSVFRQFTDTPIEDIQVITTLGNINPERDVVGMMDWIRRNGAKDDSANIDFGQSMPGYRADASLWRTKDYSFLLVHDFGGYYIYGFSGGRGVHLPAPRERLRLR